MTMDDCRALLSEWLDGGHTDDLRARTERFLDATDPGAAPAGYEAALAWFRADPERMRDLDDVDNRSAAIAIVRAALAGDAFGPAGRDLTAQDVDDALHIDCPTNEQIAERLNRIARPSGGVGHLVGVSEAQPDSDDPPPPHCLRCADGLTTGYLESERDFLREELEKAAAEIDRLRTGSEQDDEQGPCAEKVPGCTRLRSHTHTPIKVAPAAFEQAFSDAVASSVRGVGAAAQQWMEQMERQRSTVVEGEPLAPQPRSWSVPVPPPDDVTVEVWVSPDGTVTVRGEQDVVGIDEHFRPPVDAVRWGPVVEGEPPAPEPPFAVGDRVRSKSGETLGTVTEVGRGQALDERRVSFVDGWDRWIDVSDLEPAPEPQAAEPPRFERGFYRLARDLSVKFTGSYRNVRLVAVSDSEGDVVTVWTPGHGEAEVSAAALAAAGAVRVEEEQA